MLVALAVWSEEMGPVVRKLLFPLGSKGPGSGGRGLPKHPQGHPEQNALTIKSNLVFPVCTNFLKDRWLQLLGRLVPTAVTRWYRVCHLQRSTALEPASEYGFYYF